MSVSALIAAILLAGAPTNPSSLPAAVPVILEDSSAGTQDIQASSTSSTPPLATDLAPAVAPVEARVQTEIDSQEATSSKDQGDIVVSARRATPGDPLERINIKTFEAIQAVDKAVIGPVSLTFERVVPSPIRFGLRNALYNLQGPVIAINFFLQIKPGKGMETLGRFAINSTIGGAGLFDIAKRRPFNLPCRPNGFADTLGYYGVKPGPYLYLPVIGATTLRDLFGTGVDQLVLPTVVGKPFNQLLYSVPRYLVRELDQRAGFEEELRKMRASSDFYTARREFYLRTRQAEIDGLRAMHRSKKGVIPVPIQCVAEL